MSWMKGKAIIICVPGDPGVGRTSLLRRRAKRAGTRLDMWRWAEGVKRMAGNLPVTLAIDRSDLVEPGFDPGPVMAQAARYGAACRLTSARAGQNVAAAMSDFFVRHQRSWDAFERMPVGPSRFPRLWPKIGRFDSWDI